MSTFLFNLLSIKVVQAGLYVGIIVVHLVLVEGCFRVECCQCLLKLHKLSLPPLSVTPLIADVLRITSSRYRFTRPNAGPSHNVAFMYLRYLVDDVLVFVRISAKSSLFQIAKISEDLPLLLLERELTVFQDSSAALQPFWCLSVLDSPSLHDLFMVQLL